MPASVQRRVLQVQGQDGAKARVQLHVAESPRALLYWLPALGVGIGPNESFADALAERGIAVALHEWRGLGQSDRRAARRCDWGYRELLEVDIPAGLDAVQAELAGLPRWMGGHSLGGQLALIHAARQASQYEGAMLVATGQPHWRGFDGARAAMVLAFASAIPGITALAGYFPGSRLRFAGREAAGLMCDWAGTALRGDYRVRSYGGELDTALAGYRGRVLALRMREDWLAPKRSLDRLRELTPEAAWQVAELGRESFATRRPDHFGWLREPGSVVEQLCAWRSDAAPLVARDRDVATTVPTL
jgi:predicted alpha/beta hydrolase